MSARRVAVSCIAWLGLLDIALPPIALCYSLDQRVSGGKKMRHVADEENAVCETAEDPERRLKVEHIAHDCAVMGNGEEMIVIKRRKIPRTKESRKYAGRSNAVMRLVRCCQRPKCRARQVTSSPSAIKPLVT